MANVSVGDILELRFVSTFGEQTAFNVRHYAVVAPLVGAISMKNIADQVSAAMAPFYKNAMAATARYEGLGIRRLAPLPVSLEEYSSQGAGAGAVVGDALPRQISGLLRFRTTVAGRKGRGRMYVPFPGESWNGPDSKPVADYVTLLENFADALEVTFQVTSGANSVSVRPVLWSRSTRISTDITLGFAANIWATQRRRGSFGRPNTNPVPVGA